MQTQVYSCFPKKEKQVVFCVAQSPKWYAEPINTISVSVGDGSIYIHAYGKEGLQSVITALQGLTESLCKQLENTSADQPELAKIS